MTVPPSVLKYIANIQVADPNAERKQYDTPRFPPVTKRKPARDGLKQLLDQKGPEAVKRLGAGSEEAAHHRHHHAGRPPVPAVHPDAHPRHA